MRKFIIDTDTATDDVVAIIAALRARNIEVLALTVVAGNVELKQAVKNSLIAIQVANTYKLPVYIGMAEPLCRKLVKAENVHGEDGMGNTNLFPSKLKPEKEHAVCALIRLIEENPYEIELISLGPLTNVAMACLRAPKTMEKLKSMTLMVGSGPNTPGNTTETGEFNAYVDAEALSIVLDLNVPKFLVGLDVITRDTFVGEDSIKHLKESEFFTTKFILRITKSIKKFNENIGNEVFDLADPTAMAATIWPDIVEQTEEVYVTVETNNEENYGQMFYSIKTKKEELYNATICLKIHREKYRKHMIDVIFNDGYLE